MSEASLPIYNLEDQRDEWSVQPTDRHDYKHDDLSEDLNTFLDQYRGQPKI